MHRRPAVRGIAWYTALIAIALVIIGPLVWMMLTSVKSNAEATRFPPTFLPEQWSTEGYDTVLTTSSQTPVLRWFLNSLIAATGHCLLVLAVASAAAYALARLDFRGKKTLFGLIVGTMVIPGFVFLVPNFLIVDAFGWLDTLWALIVPSAAAAFNVFFLRQFFLSLPIEMEEAARIDGANHFQIFTRVVLPLSKPALATLAVLSFLTNWNEFVWPIFVLFSPESFTLPPGLSVLQGAYTVDYAVIMAGAMLASIPVIVLFIFTQRYVIEGVARSGIKG